MQFEIFTIPVVENLEQLGKMNRFLRGHRIVQVGKELIHIGEMAYWSFCVEYLNDGSLPQPFGGERKERVDYKNVLSEEAFAVFSQLRTFRKRIADDDGVPAYAVFTDAELAEISKMADKTLANLSKIENVGKKRVEKYGEKLLQLYSGEQSGDNLLFKQ